MNKEKSDQKYGWRIHDDPVKVTEIGCKRLPCMQGEQQTDSASDLRLQKHPVRLQTWTYL